MFEKVKEFINEWWLAIASVLSTLWGIWIFTSLMINVAAIKKHLTD